ncbi:MAG TPA: chemotaxis protein CheD [Candidatus Saccharimonadales bacterium]|nr:chemotaxis protein CheD [Candidatus Saccharimonadales bacterium]
MGTADFAVAPQGYMLASQGIGSCVVVCFYDQAKKIGALCHIMLPKQPAGSELNPLRFADTAIPLVLEKLEQMGSSHHDLVAHLVGGASMFQNVGTFINHVGEENVAAIQAILAEQGIPIGTMQVGGNRGRNVQFLVESGALTTISNT